MPKWPIWGDMIWQRRWPLQSSHAKLCSPRTHPGQGGRWRCNNKIKKNIELATRKAKKTWHGHGMAWHGMGSYHSRFWCFSGDFGQRFTGKYSTVRTLDGMGYGSYDERMRDEDTGWGLADCRLCLSYAFRLLRQAKQGGSCVGSSYDEAGMSTSYEDPSLQ